MPSSSSINVSLTPELCAWITAQVASGRYRSASEVVRSALRQLQAVEQHPPVERPVVPAGIAQ